MVFRQCFDCENNCTQIIPWHQMANKHVLMAALTYNLHKYLRFLTQERKTAAHAMKISAKSLKKRRENAAFVTFYTDRHYPAGDRKNKRVKYSLSGNIFNIK
jgi:hypothetical protein